MVSVTRQRRHAQLVPESYQEVQVSLTPKPDLLCVHCATVLTNVSIARRPAVSTTVRWPALTPLKRKGNQHFTVDHSYSAVLKPKCVNLGKLIPQGGWSQMDPQRSSLLLG